MTIQSIYIISTLEKSKINQFKIGRHSGSKESLLSRYRTYLIDPICFYFRSVSNSISIEDILKQFFTEYRIKNNNGNYTEWLNLDLPQIIFNIDKIIDKNYDKNENENDIIGQNKNDIIGQNKNNKHKCPKCSTIFKQKSHLDQHLNNKKSCTNNNKKIKCKHCDKLYSRKDSLKRHMEAMHVKLNENNLNVKNHSGDIHNNNINIKGNININIINNGNHSDLSNIGESVKLILGNTYNDFVDTSLGDIKRVAEPINSSIDKTTEFNNGNIILDHEVNQDKMKKLLGNMTIEEFREKFEIYNQSISLKKKLAVYLLDRIRNIDRLNYDLIKTIINNTIKPDDMNIIIKNLNRCLFLTEVSYDILQKQIQLENEINNFITMEFN